MTLATQILILLGHIVARGKRAWASMLDASARYAAGTLIIHAVILDEHLVGLARAPAFAADANRAAEALYWMGAVTACDRKRKTLGPYGNMTRSAFWRYLAQVGNALVLDGAGIHALLRKLACLAWCLLWMALATLADFVLLTFFIVVHCGNIFHLFIIFQHRWQTSSSIQRFATCTQANMLG